MLAQRLQQRPIYIKTSLDQRFLFTGPMSGLRWPNVYIADTTLGQRLVSDGIMGSWRGGETDLILQG